MIFKNVVATALLGASAVSAHLVMTNPVPYGLDSLNNFPLDASGSDFPCKQRAGVYDITKENTYSVGDPIPLAFKGSATHGGGSCQISLTTDRQPSKDSNWMVIKSIEGGCPLNIEGNIQIPGAGKDTKVPTDLNFTIPDGINSGKYTMAWTWFNRVGNREMYMNCAPVTIGGGSPKRSEEDTTESSTLEKRGKFPGMFVANVNGCQTSYDTDIRFPDPGDNVEYSGNPSHLLKEGQQVCSGTPKFTAGSGGSSSGSGSGGGSSGSSPSASASVSLSVGGGSAPTQTASSSESSAPAPTQPAPSSSSSSSGSSGSAQSGSCDTEGAWNCIDGSTFQRCASGKWTEAQQMAAGTECTPGQDSQNLSIKASINARMSSEMRHRKRAVHGAHHHV